MTKFFQSLIFCVTFLFIYNSHCASLPKKGTMFEDISTNCGVLKKSNDSVLDSIKSLPVFGECQNWADVRAINSSHRVSAGNISSIRCLLYYESFIALCENSQVTQANVYEMIFSKPVNMTVETVCSNLKLLPNGTERSHILRKIIHNEKVCKYICPEYEDGVELLSNLCAKSYSYNNFISMVQNSEAHEGNVVVTQESDNVQSYLNLDERKGKGENEKPGPVNTINGDENAPITVLPSNSREQIPSSAPGIPHDQISIEKDLNSNKNLLEPNVLQKTKVEPILAETSIAENPSVRKSNPLESLTVSKVVGKTDQISDKNEKPVNVDPQNEISNQNSNVAQNVAPNEEDIFNQPKVETTNTGLDMMPEYSDVNPDNQEDKFEKPEVQENRPIMPQEGSIPSDAFVPVKVQKVNPMDDPYSYDGDMEGNSSFFTYFSFICVAFVIGYVGYHNKQKVLALLVEGRSSRRPQRSRRPNSANYHKLDSNLEEAISSSCSKNTSHIIY